MKLNSMHLSDLFPLSSISENNHASSSSARGHGDFRLGSCQGNPEKCETGCRLCFYWNVWNTSIHGTRRYVVVVTIVSLLRADCSWSILTLTQPCFFCTTGQSTIIDQLVLVSHTLKGRMCTPSVLWLYEILEMAQPFVSFTAVGRFLNRFWSSKGAQFRPPISKLVHTKEVKSLLDKAWSTKHQERPSASEFEDIMRKECVAFNQDLGMNVSARRSTFIFVKGQGEKVNELKRRKLKSKGEGCFPT